jgi:putative flippase GtrA
LPNQSEIEQKRPLKSLSGEFGRYFVVSLFALATDYGLLLLFHGVLGLYLLLGNAISFSIGAIVAYLGSIFWVFGHRRLDRPEREFLMFFVIGLGGLLINEAVLWLFTATGGIPYQFSKIFAAGSSFVFNFIVRKWLLFRESNNPSSPVS